MKYDAEIRAAIARWSPALGVRIDPALVHAIIEKESTHGLALETAESKGRRSFGPMMVLDSTARGYGVSDPATLKNPATGILWGVRYLGDMLVRFPGDTSRAISAYNAGPGNANRNAAGKFPNQSYVDRVRLFWKLYGSAVAGGAVVLVLVAAGLYLLRRARRGG